MKKTSREKEESREKTQRERGVDGKKLIRGNSFLLNSNPRKLCTWTPRFLLLKPEGKPRYCVNYRKNQ